MAEFLLAHGANPAIRNKKNKLASDLALAADFPELAALLVPKR
jgi:ankyrin repeat protein